jgi:hypothetical protein
VAAGEGGGEVPDDPDEMWQVMLEGSEEQADLLGTDDFGPDALAAVDEWLAGEEAPLDDDGAATLGLFLARVLCETHGGGLTRIDDPAHPLAGEWTVSGFSDGLDEDYAVPFFVSATRIAVDRSLTAEKWYRQILDEGRGSPRGPAPGGKRRARA